MYKFNQNAQMSLYDLNQPIGLKMNPENRWVKKAETIPWDAIEERYAKLFPSHAEREGHYPERVLVDQIYRTRKNLSYCRERGIRMSGPLLGRPRKDVSVRKEERKIAYKDNTDRIAVERAFALAKHSYGLGLITAKLDETTRNAIAMSVLVMNIDRILAKRMFIYLAKIYGLIRRAILETIQGSNDGSCIAAAY